MKWMWRCSLACTLLSLSTVAAEKVDEPTKSKQDAQKYDKAPSMAFLNYLAEMTEVDGNLVGPQDLPEQKLPPNEEMKQSCIEIKSDTNQNTERNAQQKSKPIKELGKMTKENTDKKATIKEECQRDE